VQLKSSVARSCEQSNELPQEEGNFLTNREIIKEFYLLGYNATKSAESQPTFQRNLSPPSSRLMKNPCHKPACYLLHAGFLLGLFFNHEDGVNMFFRMVELQQTTKCYIPEDSL
jgi:hypothetical protein